MELLSDRQIKPFKLLKTQFPPVGVPVLVSGVVGMDLARVGLVLQPLIEAVKESFPPSCKKLWSVNYSMDVGKIGGPK